MRDFIEGKMGEKSRISLKNCHFAVNFWENDKLDQKWAWIGSWVGPIEEKKKKRIVAVEIRTHDRRETRADDGSTRERRVA